MFGRGGDALKYDFAVVPISIEGIPAGAGAEEVSIVWERHDKLSLTQAERVAADGSASFREIMRQTATLRRSGHSFDPKDYSFKLQAVSYTAKGHEKRRTLSKTKLDMSAFATSSRQAEEQELTLQLQPYGKLHLRLSATWLQHAPLDDESVSRSGSDTTSVTPSSSHYSEDFQNDAGSSAAVLGSRITTADTAASAQQALQTPPAAEAGAAAPALAAAVATGLGTSTRHRHQRSIPSLPEVREGEAEGVSRSDSGAAPASVRTRSASTVVAPAGSPLVLPLSSVAPALACASLQSSGSSGGAAEVAMVGEEAYAFAASEGEGDVPVAARGGGSWFSGLSVLVHRGRDQQGSVLGPKQAPSEELLLQAVAAGDVAALQALARTLLEERDDARARARYAEAQVSSLEHAAQVSEAQRQGLTQRLADVEAHLAATRESVLLDRLVEAKVELAQSDLTITDLRGQLQRERAQGRQMVARMTTMEQRLDVLAHQQQGGKAAPATAVGEDGCPMTPPRRSSSGSFCWTAQQ